MEVARHVLETYFKDTPNALVRHHLDSYSELLDKRIPTFIRESNPVRHLFGDGRTAEIYIGGKKGNEIRYAPPVDEMGNAILPHQCRLENKTYALNIYVTMEFVYTIGSSTETRRFEDVLLASIPLMVKSSLCYLSAMTGEELYECGECKFELGGYFIIDGKEKALLIQERLAENMFAAGKRATKPFEVPGVKSLVEVGTVAKLEGATKADKFEYNARITTMSEDGTRGPYSHFLTIPPANVKPDDPTKLAAELDLARFSTKRLASIQLPGFTQPVPLLSVFYALGLTNDQDIYETILAGIPEYDRTQYDEIFMELVLSHEKHLQAEMLKEKDQNQDPELLMLRRQTHTRSEGAVYMNLYNKLFSNCQQEDGESSASFYRKKAYMLGHMTRMAIDVALGITKNTDRDHLRFKRLYSAGDLVFQQFRRIYREIERSMRTQMDSVIEYQGQNYRDKKVAEIVNQDNITKRFWTGRNFMYDISKSFKGKWGGKDGVSQELTRLSYLGAFAQLRRVNVDVDKGTKLTDMRRIHCSSWGLMCPTDNPDGGNVGLIKSLSILCSITTDSPSSKIREIVKSFRHFTPISKIHPATWNPQWSRVYINSDLVGICERDTDSLHLDLLGRRRSGEIDRFVSLGWNRLNNEYSIFTDAGRPCRPIYREGTKSEEMRRLKKWSDMVSKHMDFIDASESETIRVSMEPFSPTLHSEIHGITILSPSSSVLPNSDFDPGTRNAFSCQQAKQAASWFSSAFNKRFDVLSLILNSPQRPISQTWTYPHIFGGNGCLPYGENVIVALAVYTGYNQEDSVLLNDSALRRGMFHTTYYHSYDIQEEVLQFDFSAGSKSAARATEFASIAKDPKYRETVVRKEGYDYDKLDGDGIIKVGESVTENTILVGIVTPVTNASNQVIGFRDSSSTPKRGQTGVVDSVHKYVTADGVHAVKIRVAEHRVPILGDKFSARHGQKGTCGLRVPEQDMPYTASGLRPDMIVNPHAFPSRMTIGQFVEAMSCKLGVHMGALIDATPFSAQNRVGEMKDLLLKAGFHPYGHEVMYNGQTGEMMDSEIFMAPTYYLRSKLMVEDKINYRATGPRKLLTRQPLEGRANDGGLKIGEMERDCVLSHGVSKFLNESLMERSDRTDLLFQPESGLLDVNPELVTTVLSAPYSISLLIHELEAMHISVNLVSDSS